MKQICLLLFLGFQIFTALAQPDNLFVDKQGVLRYKKSKEEAVFFGVNYTLPFAYAYRSHQQLGIDWKQAIDQDVYHLSRLGIAAIF